MTVDRNEVAAMDSKALVSAYNQLTGGSVKKFSDRATGVKRVLAAMDNAAAYEPAPPGETAPEDAAAPGPTATAPAATETSQDVEKPAAKRKGKAKAAKAEKTPRESKSEYVPPKGVAVKPSREGSKRGKFIAKLQTAAGLTSEQAQKAFGWTDRDVMDVLTQLAKFQGYHTKRDDAGAWRIVE